VAVDSGVSESMGSRTSLLILRHGQTPWNAAGIWQGQANPGLTDLGREQAHAAAAALIAMPERPWRRIVASDLARADETARIVADALSLPLEFDARLRERDVGFWSGKSKADIEREDGETLEAFYASDPNVRPGGGESTHDLRRRAFAAITAIQETWPGEETILVTHLGWIRSLVPGAEVSNAGRLALVAEEILSEPIEATASVGRGLL